MYPKSIIIALTNIDTEEGISDCNNKTLRLKGCSVHETVLGSKRVVRLFMNVTLSAHAFTPSHVTFLHVSGGPGAH